MIISCDVARVKNLHGKRSPSLESPCWANAAAGTNVLQLLQSFLLYHIVSVCVLTCLQLALGFQLEAEGLGHAGGRGAGQAEVHLHRVVDEPLQGGQGSDHDDTRAQALPHT
jgi:hypothetical protein